MRTSSSQSMSSGAKVTRPSASASSASSASPARASTALSASSSPRKRVCSRVRPLPIGSGPRFMSPTVTAAGVGVRVDVLEHPGQLERAVGGERELEQRAGEAGARLDQRDEGAAGDVEALQRALEVVHDLVGQPVVAVREQQLVVGEDARRRRRSVRNTQVPSSSSLVRRSRIRSSSSRVTASVQNAAPCSCTAATSSGASSSGPVTVISTVRAARSSLRAHVRGR